MFYKIIKDNKIIDVLDNLLFLKYQKKHDRMIFCDVSEAEAIFSSDKKKIWHEESLYEVPVAGYETVKAVEIDEYEYNQLKVFNCKTAEDAIDQFVLNTFKDSKLLVESLKRLYDKHNIDKDKVNELFERRIISLSDKENILN